MSAVRLVTWNTTKNSHGQLLSNQATFDFQSIKVGADALEISQQGSGVSSAFNFNNKKLANIADAVNTNEAATLGQMNAAISLAVLTGGSLKEAVLISEQLSTTQGILAAAAFSAVGQPANGDTFVLKDGTTTETWTFGSNAAFTPAIGGTVAVTMQNLANRINTDSVTWGAKFVATGLKSMSNSGVIVIYEKTTSAGNSASRFYGTWATQANAEAFFFNAVTEYKTNVGFIELPSADPGAGRFGFRRTISSLINGEIHYAHETDVMQAWDEDGLDWTTFQNGSVPDATSGSGGGIKGKVTADSDTALQINAGVLKLIFDTSLFVGGSGLAVNLKPGGALQSTGTGLDVGAAQIQYTHLNGNVAGDGLTGGAGNPLAVGAGDGISVVGNAVNAKANTNQGILVDQDGIAIKLDTATGGLQLSGAGIAIGSQAVTSAMLGGVAGNGLQGGNGSQIEAKAGDGISVSGAGIAVHVQGSSLDVSASGLKIATGGVGTTELAAGVAGDGLQGAGGAALSVKAADSSVVVTSSGVSVNYSKSLTNGETSAMTALKIAYVSSTGSAKLASANVVSDLNKYAIVVVQDASISAGANGMFFVKPGCEITGFAGLTPGDVYISKATLGALTQDTSAFTTGDHVYRVGEAINSSTIIFNPEHLIEL